MINLRPGAAKRWGDQLKTAMKHRSKYIELAFPDAEPFKLVSETAIDFGRQESASKAQKQAKAESEAKQLHLTQTYGPAEYSCGCKYPGRFGCKPEGSYFDHSCASCHREALE